MTNRALALVVVLGLVACKGGGETPIVAGTDGGTGTGTGSGSNGSNSSGASTDAGGDRCSLPKVVGPCDAAMLVYWFNAATEKCEPFLYGGCEGNANRFDSAEACVTACAPGAAVDPCKAITCDEGKQCVYQGATPVCAEPCEEGSTCSEAPDRTCKCAASCVNCKDCRHACLP
ncbi:MAG: hypothetical protein K0S65_6066 [Labilithrix sp.]|nr:hypothetical protein [Labilithrix sp.]